MLKNLMEDKRLDFDAPLLSVRRFSAPDSDSSNSNSRQSNRFPEKKPPPPPPKRSSVPFYKSELKSGPIRNPGVVPFVWEQTPGQPKSGDPRISGDPIARPLGRPPAAPKVPPKSISKDEKTDAYAPLQTKKPVNSVRTRERISASPNGVFLISSESSSISPRKVNDEKQQQQQQQQQEEEESMPANCSKEDDNDAFTDALDTLSCAESSFMNCSVSGLSGDDTTGPSAGRLADPQVQDFMMGRFLPASVAASSPQCNPRKPPARRLEPERLVEREGNGDYRPPFSLSYGYGPGSVPRHARSQEEEVEISDDDDDEEEEDRNAGHLSSKACGLLPQFCFKSSLCLLNPVPSMKAQRFLPPPHGRRINSPQIRTLHHQSCGQTEDEHSWEAVYKHKLGHVDQQSGEVGSKLTSESNHLTCSSDSLTADGSSPFRRSIGGSISPYRNEAPRFDEGKGFLGVPKGENQGQKSNEYITCEKDYDNCSEIATHEPSQQGSSSPCTEIEKKLYLDTVNMPETPYSKSSSPNTSVDIKGTLNPVVDDSEVGAVRQRIKDSLVIDSFHLETPQSKILENVDNTFNHDNNSDSQLPLKVEKQVRNDASFVPSILPPPLPNSPSESWLSRKFPSVPSKNPSRKSLLGIQVKHRKQDLVRFSADPKQESDVKPVKVHRQIRFADMLTNPLSPESEI